MPPTTPVARPSAPPVVTFSDAQFGVLLETVRRTTAPVRESAPAPAASTVKPWHAMDAQEFHAAARDRFAAVFAQPPTLGDWASRTWADASAALA